MTVSAYQDNSQETTEEWTITITHPDGREITQVYVMDRRTPKFSEMTVKAIAKLAMEATVDLVLKEGS